MVDEDEDDEETKFEPSSAMPSGYDDKRFHRGVSSLGEVTIHGGRTKQTGGGTGFGDLAAECMSPMDGHFRKESGTS